MPGWLTDHF